MGSVVRVELSDTLKAMIDRHVAAGHAASEADYLLEAVRRLAEDLDADTDVETAAL